MSVRAKWCVSGLIVIWLYGLTGCAQSGRTPGTPGKGDYSKEAAVIEQMSTSVTFENNGEFTREQTSRVRINNDAGVQQWGLLNFPYQSATQSVEIEYVRVRKADGT